MRMAAHQSLQSSGRRRPVSRAARTTSISAPLLQRKSCSCGGHCPRCQGAASVRVSQPGDTSEREADATADRVMQSTGHETHAAAPSLARKSHRPQPSHGGLPASVRAALDAPGGRLDADSRSRFESAFGHDFSQVVVHRSAVGEQSAREVGAAAYTLGHHIVFGAGRYAPYSREGGRLLAHELTHVVQHDRDGAPASIPLLSRNPSDLDPLPLMCGTYEDWVRTVLLIEPTLWSDLVTCGCFAANVADVVSSNAVIENLDCLCNVLTAAQMFYNFGADGGCWDRTRFTEGEAARLGAFLGATVVDCYSANIGQLIGILLGGGGGMTAGGAGGTTVGPEGTVVGGAGGGGFGAAVGALLGAAIVDLVALAAQNMAQQGTPLPQAQLTACERTWQRMQIQLDK
jgi:hypothetical protein